MYTYAPLPYCLLVYAFHIGSGVGLEKKRLTILDNRAFNLDFEIVLL